MFCKLLMCAPAWMASDAAVWRSVDLEVVHRDVAFDTRVQLGGRDRIGPPAPSHIAAAHVVAIAVWEHQRVHQGAVSALFQHVRDERGQAHRSALARLRRTDQKLTVHQSNRPRDTDPQRAEVDVTPPQLRSLTKPQTGG